MSRRIGLLLALFCLPGCGTDELFQHDAKPVTITGTVTYRGYIVNGGWIAFSPEETGSQGDVLMAEIMSDGTFQASDGKQFGLHPGRYRMTVRNHPSQFGNLPRRYSDPLTSGLKCAVYANQPLRLRIELD